MTLPRNYLFGIVVSFVLAGLLAFLGGVAVFTPNLGWGAAALLAYAVLFGGPLAAALLLIWAWYLVRDRGGVPMRAHALMLAPPLLAAMIVPVHDAVQHARRVAFYDAHPSVLEVHVNRSRDTIWPDSRGTTGAQAWLPPVSAQELRFWRYQRNADPDLVASGQFPYANGRLQPEVQHYVYRQQDGTPGPSLPLRRLPYPDLERLSKAVGGEASVLAHQYFHHDDYVEVAPGIARFGLTKEDAAALARIEGFAMFSLENHTSQALVRVEINGQTLDLGDYGVHSLIGRSCDNLSRGASPALVDLAQPLRVRWQTVDAADTWHEAQVSVPAFGPASQADPKSTLTRVRLYVLPDGQVAAERYREIPQRSGLSVRATGVPAQAAAIALCGGAYATYNPETVKLLRD